MIRSLFGRNKTEAQTEWDRTMDKLRKRHFRSEGDVLAMALIYYELLDDEVAAGGKVTLTKADGTVLDVKML